MPSVNHDRINGLPAKSRLEVWERIRHLAASGITATPDMLAQIIDRVEQDPALSDHDEAKIRRSYLRHPKQTDDQVVYYLRFADRIKIGTTSNPTTRLLAIPHDEVLATEPGGYTLERQRHQQFRNLHITGEWFRLDSSLTEHIAAITAAHELT